MKTIEVIVTETRYHSTTIVVEADTKKRRSKLSGTLTRTPPMQSPMMTSGTNWTTIRN